MSQTQIVSEKNGIT